MVMTPSRASNKVLFLVQLHGIKYQSRIPDIKYNFFEKERLNV